MCCEGVISVAANDQCRSADARKRPARSARTWSVHIRRKGNTCVDWVRATMASRLMVNALGCLKCCPMVAGFAGMLPPALHGTH
jgi:hypothetical protein